MYGIRVQNYEIAIYYGEKNRAHCMPLWSPIISCGIRITLEWESPRCVTKGLTQSLMATEKAIKEGFQLKAVMQASPLEELRSESQ